MKPHCAKLLGERATMVKQIRELSALVFLDVPLILSEK